jgi:phenylalanyl-tRNA synthetase beta chain
MKVPVSWLRDYVDIDLSISEIARRLTLAGTETLVVRLGSGWQGVVIGQVTAVEPHPNADRLRLATINLGAEKQAVVCGAPNIEPGQKIAFACAGTELIDGHTGEKSVLKPAKIRGVLSAGMVCSEKELGMSESHEGILVLAPEAPLGAPLADFLGETVLDLEVTPNRPDLLSVIGVAREVAALTGKTAAIPDPGFEPAGAAIDRQVSVEIIAADLCPRYCASLVSGVALGESPEWLKQRLTAAGMRPISNIVDITNYVMLEYGQPLHAFDYDKIKGGRIIVRRAAAGEDITTLDGVERHLSANTLVIADTQRAVAIAGVMGGLNSEISPATGTILLESASFNPASIHFTSRSLGLVSEASTRFERGIRADMAQPALKRAVQLILHLAGGKAARGIVDAYPGCREPEPVPLRIERLNAILDSNFDPANVVKILLSLGCCIETREETPHILVVVPPWRADLRLEVDLIEEVARVTGYDRIPETMLARPLARQNPAPILGLKKRVRQTLSGFGFQEAVTFALTSRELGEKAYGGRNGPEPLRLANAMTAEQEYLRTGLRGNLLAAIESNRRHEDSTMMLFELGRVYLRRAGDLPEEPEMLCGVLSGSGGESLWKSDMPVDFFTAKGAVESLLSRLGISAGYKESNDPGLKPGRQANIVVDNKTLGVLGQVHPDVARSFDIAGDVFLFELDVTALLPFTLGHRTYQPIPRFPSVARDIALVVDMAVSHGKITKAAAGFPLVDKITLFDVYTGKQVPPGKKSLAYHLSFQSPDHTLTDEEVDKVLKDILDKLAKELGAVLRA